MQFLRSLRKKVIQTRPKFTRVTRKSSFFLTEFRGNLKFRQGSKHHRYNNKNRRNFYRVMMSIANFFKVCIIFQKPDLRDHRASRLNSSSNLAASKCGNGIGLSLYRAGVQLGQTTKSKRNPFAVYALPEVPLHSGPPSSSNSSSWILGLVMTFILPFFTNKWGPLSVLKYRIDNTVQTVEAVAEAVEKVAGQVDKIAEGIADDLPDGKLKDLAILVEHVAEDTAKTADCVDNIIDKVQDAEEQVEEIVESIAKSSPEEVKVSVELKTGEI